MSRARMHCCTIALPMILLLSSWGRADYVTQTYALNVPTIHAAGPTFGTVKVEAYNGVGASGGGLQSGQVRLTYMAYDAPFNNGSSLVQHAGLENVGFNTNLTLTSSQIKGPTGWTNSANTSLDGDSTKSGFAFGKYSWEVGSPSNAANLGTMTVLISGLGANATLANFLVGKVPFAAEIDDMTYRNGVNTDITGGDLVGSSGVTVASTAPEPSALLLGAFGMGSVLLGRKTLRKSRGKATQAILPM